MSLHSAHPGIARFSVVGLLATALHIGIAYTARTALDLDPAHANAVGFAAAFVASYLGHHRFTFQRSGNHGTHLSRFLVLSALSYLTSHVITVTVTGQLGMRYEAALAAILLVVPATTYLGGRFWAFAEVDRKQDTHADWWTLASWAAIAAIAGWTWFRLQGTAFNHDTSWYFVATRMWMEGTPLYSGIMEINPPMPFYITRAILQAGDWFGLADADAFRTAIFAAAALSLALTGRILTDVPVSPAARAALLVVVSLVFFIVPLYDFGQREHILLILVMPYVLASAIRIADWPQPPARIVLMALFALPALLLKPHFLALPLLLTLYRMYERRSLRPLLAPDNLLIGTAAVMFLAVIWFYHRDYLDVVVPLGRTTYGTMGAPAIAILAKLVFIAIAAAAWRLLATDPQSAGMRAFKGALLAALAAGVAIDLLQFKGFSYHLVPLHGFALLAAVWILLANSSRSGRIGAVVALALVAYIAVVSPLRKGPYDNPLPDRIRSAIDTDLAGRPAMVFSTNVYRAFPLINVTGMRWTSRYPAQWIVPGAWVGLIETPSEKKELRAQYRQALDFALRTNTEDFLKGRPEFVIVDTREEKSYFAGHDFDWIDFMKGDPAFADAWRNYRLEATVPDFEIWRRRDS